MVDDKAFETELTAVIPRLRGFAHSLAYNSALADDLVQDTLIRAWNARASYEAGTNMQAWTFLILRNVFFSLRRRAWREEALDPDFAERSLVTAEVQSLNLELDDLRRALALLSDEHREALVLVGAAGLSYEEAAEIIGCPVGTIKSRVSRARLALSKHLDSEGLDGAAPTVIPSAGDIDGPTTQTAG